MNLPFVCVCAMVVGVSVRFGHVYLLAVTFQTLVDSILQVLVFPDIALVIAVVVVFAVG